MKTKVVIVSTTISKEALILLYKRMKEPINIHRIELIHDKLKLYLAQQHKKIPLYFEGDGYVSHSDMQYFKDERKRYELINIGLFKLI